MLSDCSCSGKFGLPSHNIYFVTVFYLGEFFYFLTHASYLLDCV